MGKGPLIILSGPSGSGKSTIIRRLLANETLPLRLSVSVTTRQERPGEVDGRDYHFWPRERFLRERDADGFLEWAEVFGCLYGTLKQEVEPYRDKGQGVILEIDVQGAQQVRRRCPDAVSIFLRASSHDDAEELRTLEQRLRQRGTESEQAIEKRLQGARRELARAGEYDYQVVNDNLDRAVADIQTILLCLF
jgi:guanylate kinase